MGRRITVLIYPPFLSLIDVARNWTVEYTYGLGTQVQRFVTVDEGQRMCWPIPSEAHIKLVLLARGKSDNIDDMNPEYH